MADQGNAVTARWVGPNGYQLYDGTILSPGVIVSDIGFDEATGSPNWEIVTKLGKADTIQVSVADARTDPSFGAEEGGGSTGRPEVVTGTVVPPPALPAPEVAS